MTDSPAQPGSPEAAGAASGVPAEEPAGSGVGEQEGARDTAGAAGAAPGTTAAAGADPGPTAGADPGPTAGGDPGPTAGGDPGPTATAGQEITAGGEAAAGQSTAPDAGSDGQATSVHGCPVDPRPGAVVVHCNRGDYLALMNDLKADGYDLPVGVSGVDYLTHPGRDLPGGIRPERFEVVVELLSLAHRRRIRVRCQVPAQDPFVPSLFDLWPGTEAHERETYDMFGIRFAGHPDLSRILMPEDWEGHPLRKDYDTGHIPVQFKEAPR
jgi:NADH-quinone oxidoreductase subunit C